MIQIQRSADGYIAVPGCSREPASLFYRVCSPQIVPEASDPRDSLLLTWLVAAADSIKAKCFNRLAGQCIQLSSAQKYELFTSFNGNGSIAYIGGLHVFLTLMVLDFIDRLLSKV